MASVGGLGGLGGFDIGNLFAALGSSLLTSPRTNPLQGLPAGIQAANERSKESGSNAAMMMALTKAGIDPQTAATLALNPTAAALMISQGNAQKQQALREEAIRGIGGMSLTPPDAGSGSESMGVAPARRSDAAPLANPDQLAAAQRIAQKLVQRGIDPKVAAGVVGQMGPESGFNTGAIGDDGTAFGLIQARGDRAEALRTIAAKQGKPWTDEDVQVEHIVSELTGPEKSAYARALQAKDPQEAAYVLAKHYERPAASALARTAPARMALAQQTYGSLGGLGGVPVAQADAGSVRDDLPTNQVAGPGAPSKIPAATPDRTLPPVVAASGVNATKAWASSQAQNAMRLMIAAGDDKGLAAAAEARFKIASKYLEQTDIEKVMSAAGVSPNSPQGRSLLLSSIDKRPDDVRVAEAAYPGEPSRQRDAIRAGMKDNRPDVVKLGEYNQDSPGLVKSGQEAVAAQKGAETAATKRAEALTEESASATTTGRSAKQLITALDDAQKYFDQAAKGGGTGPAAASPVSRAVVARAFPAGSQSFKNEVARQNFDTAIAYVRNMKTVAENKGTGTITNMERVLLSSDVPDLNVADPEVARIGFARLRTRLQEAAELDAKLGLHAGEAPARPAAISTPYGTIRQK